MSDFVNQPESLAVVSRPNWGAIWAGVFTFFAIWSVFGALGLGVFASAANPNANQPVLGMNVGEAAWTIILTIIAMFVAGRATGRLAHITNSRDGMWHGMVMFGLSIVGVLLVVIMPLFGRAEAAGGAHSSYVIGLATYLGWTLFLSLFFGWLAALIGSATAHKELPQAGFERQVRHCSCEDCGPAQALRMRGRRRHRDLHSARVHSRSDVADSR